MDVNNSNQSVNPSETPTQPTQDPVNKQKGFFPIILGVLVLLLAVGGGAYYLGTQNSKSTSQNLTSNTEPTTNLQNNTVVTVASTTATTQNLQSDETASWKTYNHGELGIQFKYPTDFVVEKEDQNNITIQNPNYFGTINVTRTSLIDFNKISNCTENSQFPCKEALKTTLLDGVDAVSFTQIEGPGGNLLVVQTTEEPKIQLSMDARGGGLSRIFDQVLSSFKFTK